jgi:hypothetical protein
MNSETAASSGQRRMPSKASEYIPPGMRSARRMRNNVWPHIWMSFASILVLMAALVVLAYRMGTHSCR